MRRLHVSADLLRTGEVELVGDQAHYLGRVLRLTAGDEVELFDGQGRRARAVLLALGRRSVRCRVDELEVERSRPAWRLCCALPLIKGDRLDLAVRMLTELGADAIDLLTCARAVVKAEAHGTARVERLQRVAVAAARQCGRVSVPRIEAGLELCDYAERAQGLKLLGAIDGDQRAVERVEVAAVVGVEPAVVSVCTGPEGGFTALEADLLYTAGFAPLCLGPYVLRAETAAVVAAGCALQRLSASDPLSGATGPDR